MILSFLVARYDDTVVVDGRIAGISRIRSVMPKTRRVYVSLLVANFISLVLLGILLILPINAPDWLMLLYLCLLATFAAGNISFMRDRSIWYGQ
jgi:hypothetical protein